MAMLITPEVEQITPVSAPSMIGMETFSVPESRFTTLNGIDCPPSAQASSAMMNRNSTTPTITRRQHARRGGRCRARRAAATAASASVTAPQT